MIKNILNNSPVLKKVQLDTKLSKRLFFRHNTNIGKLQKSFRFFLINSFDNIVFLQKIQRLNQYLNVPSSKKMLDLSVKFNIKNRNDLSESLSELETLSPNSLNLTPLFTKKAQKKEHLNPKDISTSLLVPQKFQKRKELKEQKVLEVKKSSNNSVNQRVI